MAKETDPFVKVVEVIPIHIERYNSQIQRLLAVEDYFLADLVSERVDRKTFYRARENKIRSYSDCINTVVQKERVLQYHNQGLSIEVIEETITINKTQEYDFTKLSFEERVKLMNIIIRSKKNSEELKSVSEADLSEYQVEDITHEVVEEKNIDKIKKLELPPAPIDTIPLSHFDPAVRLREALKKVAAKEFQKIGGNLDETEKQLLQ